MNGKYVNEVQKLISQKSSLDPTIFAAKVQKAKSQLKQKIFEIRKEIERISYKTGVIDSSKEKDVPGISKQREMLFYLSALSNYYEAKIRATENEKKRYDDLKQFEEEIISKYDRQNQRLQKMQEYSNTIKNRLEIENQMKANRRQKRTNEAKDVLHKYQTYIAAEKRYNFAQRIQKTREKILQIQNEIHEESDRNSSLIVQRDELLAQDNKLNDEIEQLMQETGNKEKDVNDERRKLTEKNRESNKNIENYRKEIERMKNDIKEFDLMIYCATNLHPFIQEGNEIQFVI